MAEFKEILRKDSKLQIDISQTLENHNKEPHATESKKRTECFNSK